MLQTLALENYRSLRSIVVPLGRLNVIQGANGSGKSNLYKALRLLADTAAGYGCLLNLPEGGTGFTTIELKTNFMRSAREGRIGCEARLVHGGRTTQVWDATVNDTEGRVMALFRCTQLILRA